jgi:hypothetical protein
MFVYNITIKIVPEIEKEWLEWQRQEHIPDVMASGRFSEYKFYRLLEQEEPDGITYIIQYFSPSLDDYNRYIEDTAPRLRKKALDRWGNKFIAFRTIMEVVH